MSLWIDKYRPNYLSKLSYHKEQADRLKNLVSCDDFPHLLVYGPPGSGKKTRIMCLLRELYGAGIERLRIEHQSITTPSNKKLEVSTLASNYHIEVNPSDVGIYDRVVVQEILKTVAETNQLDVSKQGSFKVVILTEVDKLTKDAQHALRRTMEKYVATCRLILVCNATSKVIPAIRSRCLLVRIPTPSGEEICEVLQFVSKKENLTLPPELANRIADSCNGNLRRAILSLETCKVQEYPFTPSQPIMEPDWEVYLRKTARMVLEEQSPKRLMEVRERLYELLAHCIPPALIVRGLVDGMRDMVEGSLKSTIIQQAAYYEHGMNLGQKPIFHLEAFVARVMSQYRAFLDSLADLM